MSVEWSNLLKDTFCTASWDQTVKLVRTYTPNTRDLTAWWDACGSDNPALTPSGRLDGRPHSSPSPRIKLRYSKHPSPRTSPLSSLPAPLTGA